MVAQLEKAAGAGRLNPLRRATHQLTITTPSLASLKPS
jgi:hypothetical protein